MSESVAEDRDGVGGEEMRVGDVENLEEGTFVGEQLQVLVQQRVPIPRQVQADDGRTQMANDLAKARRRQAHPRQIQRR